MPANLALAYLYFYVCACVSVWTLLPIVKIRTRFIIYNNSLNAMCVRAHCNLEFIFKLHCHLNCIVILNSVVKGVWEVGT